MKILIIFDVCPHIASKPNKINTTLINYKYYIINTYLQYLIYKIGLYL